VTYSEELTNEIIEEYKANPNRETVDAIAARIDKSVRSVIAKLSSAGVYKTPERTTKTGDPIVKKDELVTRICTHLGVEAPTLVKAGKEDLKRVSNALDDMFGEIDV
jgi:hypothetical protein